MKSILSVALVVSFLVASAAHAQPQAKTLSGSDAQELVKILQSAPFNVKGTAIVDAFLLRCNITTATCFASPNGPDIEQVVDSRKVVNDKATVTSLETLLEKAGFKPFISDDAQGETGDKIIGNQTGTDVTCVDGTCKFSN